VQLVQGGRAGSGPDKGSAPAPDPTEVPPSTGYADVDAWLAQGFYKSWRCETAPHDFGRPSPHGQARLCSNAATSAQGAGEFPVGAASVLELYDTGGTNLVGHAVDVHTGAGKDGVDWYWFERDTALPDAGAGGLVADGKGGTTGTLENDFCVACHSQAGIGYVGHDYVFAQVK
jgi:hypothetical protein